MYEVTANHCNKFCFNLQNHTLPFMKSLASKFAKKLIHNSLVHQCLTPVPYYCCGFLMRPEVKAFILLRLAGGKEKNVEVDGLNFASTSLHFMSPETHKYSTSSIPNASCG